MTRPVILENLGNVDVRTSNGAIALTDIDGDITAKSSNGAIDGSGLSGDGIEAETSSGAIEFTLEIPQDGAKTSNGRITIEVPEGSYDVDADPGNGSEDIEIPTDPNGDYRLELRTSNGSIVVKQA